MVRRAMRACTLDHCAASRGVVHLDVLRTNASNAWTREHEVMEHVIVRTLDHPFYYHSGKKAQP